MSNKPEQIFGEHLKPSVGIQPDLYSDKYFEAEDKKTSSSGSDVCQWGILSSSVFKSTTKSRKTLLPGMYTVSLDPRDDRSVLTKKEVVHDSLIQLIGLPTEVYKEIEEFWTKDKEFEKLGFLHRRGYLFYGSHGSGKTSLINQITDNFVKEGGVGLYCTNPEVFNIGLEDLRKVEPTRKLICVFEDIDEICRKFGEKLLLSILDGDNQINTVVNLATTNYPELIDKRIVGRPRRFDRVYKIDNLEASARAKFLKQKLPSGQNVKLWVDVTEGLSIASISEVIISVMCFGKELKEAVSIMQRLAKDKSSDEYKDGFKGFKDED